VALSVILRLLLYKIPGIMILFFPMAILFTTMLVLVRLAKDSELVVLRTAGVHLFRIVLPLLVLGFVLSLLALYINEKIVPQSNHASETLVRKMILKNPLPQIQQNVFFNAGQNRYFYLRSINPATREVEGVMMYELSWTGYPRMITARKAFYRDGRWYLQGGVLHDFDASGRLVTEATFELMEIDFNREFSQFFSEVRSTLEMDSVELKKQIKSFKKSGISTRQLEVDYYLKKSGAFAGLIFSLIGVALSVTFVRSHRDFWGIIIAVGIAVLCCGFFFTNTAIFRAFGRGGVLPSLWAAWIPDLVFGTIALVLILKESFRR
jgi:lipopolysaccharide export system permease protein